MRFDSGRGRALERSESSTSREKGEGGRVRVGGKRQKRDKIQISFPDLVILSRAISIP